MFRQSSLTGGMLSSSQPVRPSIRSLPTYQRYIMKWKPVNRFHCKVAQVVLVARTCNGRPQGSGNQTSGSLEAKVKFGGLAQTSFSTPWVGRGMQWAMEMLKGAGCCTHFNCPSPEWRVCVLLTYLFYFFRSLTKSRQISQTIWQMRGIKQSFWGRAAVVHAGCVSDQRVHGVCNYRHRVRCNSTE